MTRRAASGNADEVVGREQTTKGLTYLPKESEFYPVVTEKSLRGFVHGRIESKFVFQEVYSGPSAENISAKDRRESGQVKEGQRSVHGFWP